VIRLLIVAPSAIVRAGLEALSAANPELQLVGSQSDFTGVEHTISDVILAASRVEELPATDGNGSLRFVLITGEAEPVWTSEALAAGVRALLPRDVQQSQILAAIEAAANGFVVIEPQHLESVLSSTAAPQRVADTSPLTSRELEVLRMMAEGASNKIIAWKLGISEHTVKFHVAAILSRLGASSRTEAVSIGIRKGLILL
jgi:NarL family two-component system response regulator YdfI